MGDGSQTTGAAVAETEIGSESIDARIDALLGAQSRFFESGATLPRAFREDRLRTFLAVMQRKEQRIIDAIQSDLHRGTLHAYVVDVGHVTGEIRHALKKLGSWMRPRRHLAPLTIGPSTGTIHPQPLGLNLILSPWNYPVQLALSPLVPAIAAGNVAIVKPSELAPAASCVIAEIIEEAFSPEHVAALEGGVDVAQALLARRWNHIFFTGGTTVGKLVAHAGAEHLARVTLELGGKSPTIVTDSADLPLTARRTMLGKFVNAGQTCIAPDYVLVHRSVHEQLIDQFRRVLREFFGDDPQNSPDYGRIINERHFDRLVRLIDEDKVAFGGSSDRAQRYIAPTILSEVTLDDPVMQEEIFGPILPVISFDTLDEAIAIIRRNPDPLALYLFTSNPADERTIVERVSFGGGCINNAALHFLDPRLPFGGIGNSGLGAYHGDFGFETFSHLKSVLKTGSFLDPSIKYPPYDDTKLGLFKKLVR
jgi:aldehyde dehydrogenase (NAD+)